MYLDNCWINDDECLEEFTCSDCKSSWHIKYDVRYDSHQIDEDKYNTYNKWLAEHRDKQVDSIMKDE